MGYATFARISMAEGFDGPGGDKALGRVTRFSLCERDQRADGVLASQPSQRTGGFLANMTVSVVECALRRPSVADAFRNVEVGGGSIAPRRRATRVRPL